jgi:hypothetical protein
LYIFNNISQYKKLKEPPKVEKSILNQKIINLIKKITIITNRKGRN